MDGRDWEYVFYLLRDIFKKDKKRIFCMLIKAIMGVINPYISIVLLGKLTDGIINKETYCSMIYYIVVAVILKYICTIAEARAQEWFEQKLDYTKDIEARSMNEKAMDLNYEHIENVDVVNLRYQSMSKSFYGIAGWGLLNVQLLIEGFASIIITICIIVPLVIENNPFYGLIGSRWSAVCLIIIIVLLTITNYKFGIYYTQKAKKLLDGLNNNYNKRQYYLDKYLNIEFQKDVRINNWEELMDDEIKSLFLQIKKTEYKHGNIYVKRQIISGVISATSNFLVYFFSGARAYVGMISMGSVITYASSIMHFSRKMMTFAATLGNMKSVALFAKDYYRFMTLENRQFFGRLPMPIMKDITIEFEHVSFKYPGESEYVLRDVHLVINLSGRIAIVGKNGSGKTTFIKLLCRLYDALEGCIRINGIDIRDFSLEEYWKWFSVVFQDFSILGFSVAENVAGNTQYDAGKVKEALDRAGMDNSEKQIYEKVGKSIFEEGIIFSEGEKQKIAIARAIYKESYIVIMDEPTAALDPISESEIYEGLDKLVGNKAALYISHRLSSCKFCEDIIVFDSGIVVQRGTHSKLVRQKGMYQRLWEAQADCYRKESIEYER